LTFIQPQVDAYKVYDDLISTNRVDGFILSDTYYDDPRIARIASMKAPFVAFGGMYIEEADFAYVDVDSKKGMELAVNHLAAQGHHRIGMLNYDRGWPVADAREAGYREAMHRAGMDLQPDWVVHTPNILRAASSATQQLMSAKLPPTAIVCANDVMAFGAKTYLDRVGMRVGDDFALTGYDDDPTSEFLGITSLRQPIDEVAVAVFELLLGEINGEPRSERQIVFEPTLVVRHSTVLRPHSP
jgi:LacI family transcriptional regulator